MIAEIQSLGDVAKVVNGFAFGEQFQGRTDLPIPFIKVSDFVQSEDSWLSKSANTVDGLILGNLRAKTYPKGTIIFPKVGGALLTNKRARLKVDATFDNNIMGLVPENIDGDYLFYFMSMFNMKSIANIQSIPSVRASSVAEIKIPTPTRARQIQVASHLKAILSEIEKARKATEMQILETENLANTIIYESVRTGNSATNSLGDVLDEVKKGIGDTWKEFLVLGATRNGLALAKEPPGKKPERYKPIFPGTVFYNPMRILIGSIAFVDEDDTPGITSPDYVALRGKEGVVDSRWFYYWLRSQYGKTFINSLARGAVRERMLFNRLANGEIELPEFKAQQKASGALKEIKAIRVNFERRLKELELLPNKLLIETFEKIRAN